MKFMKNDTIQVAIKKQARNYVLRYYAAFGWEFVEEKEDTRYEDTAHLSFERPHYIDNKDDLHLLQAKLEIAMNKAGKYESRKNTRATIFGIMTGLLAAGFMAGGVCYCFVRYCYYYSVWRLRLYFWRSIKRCMRRFFI